MERVDHLIYHAMQALLQWGHDREVMERGYPDPRKAKKGMGLQWGHTLPVMERPGTDG